MFCVPVLKPGKLIVIGATEFAVETTCSVPVAEVTGATDCRPAKKAAGIINATANTAAMALSGQITRFMASQEYLCLNMHWKCFGEKEARKICDTLLNLLNKILS